MLKRPIKYEDFNGDTVTEDFYFNLSKPELLELEVEIEGGFGQMLQTIVKSENVKALVKEFKRIIIMSYGIKSDDGRRFMKSDEIRTEFEQTAAYHTLFMELATDDKAAVKFLQGVLPKDMQGEIDTDVVKVAPLPPTPPTS